MRYPTEHWIVTDGDDVVKIWPHSSQNMLSVAPDEPPAPLPGAPCDQVLSRRGMLTMRHPSELWLVTDWSDVESVWHHPGYNARRAAPDEHLALLADAVRNPVTQRERMTQIMFSALLPDSAMSASLAGSDAMGAGTDLAPRGSSPSDGATHCCMPFNPADNSTCDDAALVAHLQRLAAALLAPTGEPERVVILYSTEAALGEREALALQHELQLRGAPASCHGLDVRDCGGALGDPSILALVAVGVVPEVRDGVPLSPSYLALALSAVMESEPPSFLVGSRFLDFALSPTSAVFANVRARRTARAFAIIEGLALGAAGLPGREFEADVALLLRDPLVASHVSAAPAATTEPGGAAALLPLPGSASALHL